MCFKIQQIIFCFITQSIIVYWHTVILSIHINLRGILYNHIFVRPWRKGDNILYIMQTYIFLIDGLNFWCFSLSIWRWQEFVIKFQSYQLKDWKRNDCVTYSRNRRYAYKCNTTILFMDKQGKGVVVYLRVDVTWIHIMIIIRFYKFILYFLHRATIV